MVRMYKRNKYDAYKIKRFYLDYISQGVWHKGTDGYTFFKFTLGIPITANPLYDTANFNKNFRYEFSDIIYSNGSYWIIPLAIPAQLDYSVSTVSVDRTATIPGNSTVGAVTIIGGGSTTVSFKDTTNVYSFNNLIQSGSCSICYVYYISK